MPASCSVDDHSTLRRPGDPSQRPQGKYPPSRWMRAAWPACRLPGHVLSPSLPPVESAGITEAALMIKRAGLRHRTSKILTKIILRAFRVNQHSILVTLHHELRE